MENKSPLIKGHGNFDPTLLNDEQVVPKLDKEKLDKILKEREEKIAKLDKEVITKPVPDTLRDIFKTLGMHAPTGIRPPNANKNRKEITRKKKLAKKSQRGR